VKLQRVYASVVTTKLTLAAFVINRFQPDRSPSLRDCCDEIIPSVSVCTPVLLHAYLTAACSTIELSRNLKEHDTTWLVASERTTRNDSSGLFKYNNPLRESQEPNQREPSPSSLPSFLPCKSRSNSSTFHRGINFRIRILQR
jgi:hypothetical protein